MTSISEKASAITAREKERYANMTPGSQKATDRAKKVLPLGVASNFQYFEPHPIVADHASGSRLWDVDGNEFIDYNGGYGSLFAGHAHPILVEAITAQAPKGTLFTTPSVLIAEVAEALVERFPFEMVRFTNSGTEATMDALRLARAYTGRDKIVKLEGGYHGHHDLVMMSVRPPLEKAGPADRPNTVPYYGGTGKATKDEVVIIPFNDLPALERAFTEHPGEISAFILEPVPENMGIVLPDEGYLASATEICHKYGALIIFDEVKTGITSNWGGASAIYSIQPDLICLAKSIGGGVPIAAFGGGREIMGYITDFTVAHQGTFNGNPLVTAASLAVLTKICTKEATEAAIARNARLIEGCQRVIDETGLPAHTVKLGAKGCVTYVPERVRTFRDYKKTDFELAYAHWIYMMTHGIFLPPGLDEQWLVSVAHTEADIDTHLEIFEAFVREVTA